MACAFALRPAIILPFLDSPDQYVLTLVTGFDVERGSRGLEEVVEGMGKQNKARAARDQEKGVFDKESKRRKVFFKLFMPRSPAGRSSRSKAFILGLKTGRYGRQQPRILYNARHSPFRFAQLTRLGSQEPRIVQVVILDAEPRDAIGGTAWLPRIHWSDAKSLQVRLGRHPDSPVPHRVKEAKAVRALRMPPRRAGQRLHHSAKGLRASRRYERFGGQGERSTIGNERSAGEMMGPGLRGWLEHLPAPPHWLRIKTTFIMARLGRLGFLGIAVVFHLVYILSIFDVYFRSPIVSGMRAYRVEGTKAPAKR
ncbi:hypothetical protein KC324_g11227, partial [Hortaea werneckii]